MNLDLFYTEIDRAHPLGLLERPYLTPILPSGVEPCQTNRLNTLRSIINFIYFIPALPASQLAIFPRFMA